MTSWVDGAGGSAYELDHLPYGVFSATTRRRASASGYGDTVLDVATVRPRAATGPTLNDFMAARARPPGPRPGPRSSSSPTRPTALPAIPLDRGRGCTCRSRSATTSTSTPRSTTPPTSAGSSGPTRSRCCPTGGTSRSATTAAAAPSSSAVRRSSGRAGSGKAPTRGRARRTGRAGAWTSRPSSASWSASGSELGSRIAVGDFADHVFGVVGLNDWSRPRHPGLGVRAARPVPRQVVRHLGQRLGHAARRARGRLADLPGQDPTPLAYLAPTAPTPGRSTSTSRSCSTARS